MEDSATRTSDRTPPLVLIVDDHEDSREMCATVLALAGFRSAEAIDGRDAVAEAVRLAPDCILMDLSLPGVDGLEAAHQLKADPRTRRIPVIAVSGRPDAAAADEAAFAAVLTKPCAPDAVVNAIRRALPRP
jgi:two-component system, cell cycle response regulator DivK